MREFNNTMEGLFPELENTHSLLNESTTIFNAENQSQLNRQYDELLKESFKLLLLKKLLLENKQLPKKSEDIALALNVFCASQFLRLEDENLLHIDQALSNISLSYNAQKEVQQCLWQAMQIKLQTIAPLFKKLKEHFPQFFEKKQSASVTTALIPSEAVELLYLDKVRRACFQQLAEIHKRKLELLKAAAEIKLDRHIAEKIEVHHLELCINQVKANLFRDYMINDFVNNSEHTVKAIKFVEKHIDDLLDQDEFDMEIRESN